MIGANRRTRRRASPYACRGVGVKNLKRALGACVVSLLALAPAAEAAIPGIPEDAGAATAPRGDITCADRRAAPNAGERHCSGIFTTFDGAPIDVNVGFPPAPGSGPDGDFPVIGVFHGWGGSKLGLDERGDAAVARRAATRSSP